MKEANQKSHGEISSVYTKISGLAPNPWPSDEHPGCLSQERSLHQDFYGVPHRLLQRLCPLPTIAALNLNMAYAFSSSLPIQLARQGPDTVTSSLATTQGFIKTCPQNCQRHVRTTSTRVTPSMGLFDMWRSEPADPNAPPKFGFRIGYAYLAHPEKDTGEDAFFIEGTSIGVFDGVSGASETRGVDPRLYSQRLASETCRLVKEYGAASVVKAAIEASLENDQIGASTACVIGMDNVGRIFGINLGDSGVRVIRGEKMIFRTKEQQHFFNCPYQLGTDSQDGLAMGQNIQQKVREGDVVVVASDGLYDNMSDQELVQYVNQVDDPMAMAEQLGDLASTRGVDKSYESPFMIEAKKAGVAWEGGKADDITVVVAKIVPGPDADNESLLSTIPEAE